MPKYTNFPNGIASFGIPILPGSGGGGSGGGEIHSGNVFWVDSNGAGGSDGSFSGPVPTLDAAINLCTANNGDIIYVKEGHTETITTDGGVALDVAGVTVIGLGNGSDRPTFTFNTLAAATWVVSAANVSIHNILFLGNLATLVSCLEIAGDSCEVSHCEFRETTNGMITAITVGVADGDADYTYIHDCKFYMDEPGITNAGDAAIEIIKDSDHITIEDNYIYGDFDDAGIHVPAGGNACDFLTITGNYVENTVSGNHAIEITTAGTMVGGLIANNILVSPLAGSTLESHTLVAVNNYGSDGNLINTSGSREFWVDSGTGSDSGDGSKAAPYATLDAAIALCTASSNDVIYVAAGHSESLSADSAVDIDVAGVTVIGLGSGADRPTFDFDTAATADFKLAANNVKIENLLFTTSVDSLDMMVEVSGTDCEISRCEFRGNATQQMLIAIATVGTNAADRLYVHDCTILNETAGATSAIDLVAVQADVRIENNYIRGDFSEAGIESSDILTNVRVAGNYIQNDNNGSHAIEFSAAATGQIMNNTFVTDAHATTLDKGSCKLQGNLWHDDGDVAADVAGVPFPPNPDFCPLLGYHVSAADANSPQGTVSNIFTITGGRVLVTRLVGQVGTVVQAASSIWKITHNPTVGSSVDLAADLECNGFNAGTLLHAELDGTALVGTDGQETVLAVNGANSYAELDVGVIEWESGESTTGTAKWDLWYWPIEDGAHVTGS